LDIVQRDSEIVQSIKAKVFQGDIRFTQDTEADGLVDGVDLKNWSPIRRIPLEKNQISKKVIINGDLISKSKFNIRRNLRQGSYDILPILKYIAPLNSTKLPGNCALSFETLVVNGNTLVRREINGIRTSNWVRKDFRGSYNISGIKWFQDGFELGEDASAKALYAGVGEYRTGDLLNILPNLLINGVDQTIYEDTAFEELLTVSLLRQFFCDKMYRMHCF
jgi:hypothetical protein